MDDDLTLDHMIELLEDVKGNVDYENCTTLVDDRVLDSFDILSIISSINDEFDVSVPAKDIVPDNFNSAQAMLDMVKRLVDEEGARADSWTCSHSFVLFLAVSLAAYPGPLCSALTVGWSCSPRAWPSTAWWEGGRRSPTCWPAPPSPGRRPSRSRAWTPAAGRSARPPPTARRGGP